jgi:hypothetical protein
MMALIGHALRFTPPGVDGGGYLLPFARRFRLGFALLPIGRRHMARASRGATEVVAHSTPLTGCAPHW